MPLDLPAVAAHHGFSPDAVLSAWNALRNSGGAMAQFSHPELGGSGQWMPNMLQIGDMFNSALKARVDALFWDLTQQPLDADPPPTSRPEAAGRAAADVSLRYAAPPPASSNWYPADLGTPSTAGAQNHARYAYFPQTRRLAVEAHGRVTVYDTADHLISGVAQAQSDDAGTMTFTSQHGPIPISSLRVVG